MNLRRLRNLVLSLVGALFLTVLFCGANAVKADSSTRDGRSVYFLRSTEQYGAAELTTVNFGGAISVDEIEHNQYEHKSVVYFNNNPMNYYLKISTTHADGFVDSDSWFYDDPVIGLDGNYVLFDSHIESDGSKNVALYYIIQIANSPNSHELFFRTDANDRVGIRIAFINESVDVANRPDIVNGANSITFTNGATAKNYYESGSLKLDADVSDVTVYEPGEAKTYVGKLKVKMDGGIEGLAIGSSATFSLDVIKSGSGLKGDVWYTSLCSEVTGGYECAWSAKSSKYEHKVYDAGTYYYGIKMVSNIDTVVIRIFKVTLVANPKLDLTKGLVLTNVSTGTVLNPTIDGEGNVSYPWSSGAVELEVNATKIYKGNRPLSVYSISYNKDGVDSELCGFVEIAGKSFTSCNNTGESPIPGVGDSLFPIKTVTLSYNIYDEGVNNISFVVALNDASRTTFNINVSIRLDFKKPTDSKLETTSPSSKYNGATYYSDPNLKFAVGIKDDITLGRDLYSGIKGATYTVAYKGNLYYTPVSSTMNNASIKDGDVIDLSGVINEKKVGNYSSLDFCITIVANDYAGNSTTSEFYFFVELNMPNFNPTSQIRIDSSSVKVLDSNSGISYYKTLKFSVYQNDIIAGNSGIKKVEYCFIDVTNKTIARPTTEDCTWITAVLEGNKYTGNIDSGDLSGEYRIVYKVTANNGMVTSNDNLLYNNQGSMDGLSELYIDNKADLIEFVEDVNDVWGNTDIDLSFSVNGTYSPVQSVKVFNALDEEIENNLVDDVYMFSVSENGEYSVVVTDLVGNVSNKDFVIKGIDRVNPVISSVKFGSNYISDKVFLNEVGSITINAYDDNSGISRISANAYKSGEDVRIYSSNKTVSCDDDTCSSLVLYLSDSNISENGLYELEIEIFDRAGNTIKLRKSLESQVFVEEKDGKVVLNGIKTEIDFVGSEVVTIGENGTWLIDGVDTSIGAVYEFNYLNGSPEIEIQYYPYEGAELIKAEGTIYTQNKLHLVLTIPDIGAQVDLSYSICTDSSKNCNSFNPVSYTGTPELVIDDSSITNNGKINYIKIRAMYNGDSNNVTEKLVAFMIDNIADVITVSAPKENQIIVSKTVEINVVSEKNGSGGTDKNRLLYFYSDVERDDVDSIEDFVDATVITGNNSVSVNLNGHYYFYYEDKALNGSIGHIRITVIDNLHPTVNYLPTEWNKVYPSFSTTLSVTDDAKSNAGSETSRQSIVTHFAYAWTMNPDATYDINKLTSVTSNFESVKTIPLGKGTSSYTTDGVYYLYVYVKDSVGNEYQGVNTEYYVVIDNTVPSTDNIRTTVQFRSGSSWVNADSNTLWFNSSVNIKVAASEYSFKDLQYVDIIDGVYGKVVYAIGDVSEPDNSYSYSKELLYSKFSVYKEDGTNGIVMTKEGQFKVFIYAIDEANNVSGPLILYINIDLTAPSLKQGYTSVLGGNFSHSIEKASSGRNPSYESIIDSSHIVNYTDNADIAGVIHSFDGIYTDKNGQYTYICENASGNTLEDRITFTRNNFLSCAKPSDEDLAEGDSNRPYYIKLVLTDRAGNQYVEYVEIFVVSSVPPVITIIKTTLGCDDNLATTVLCHRNAVTNQYEIKLVYGDEDIDGNRYITTDSRVNPKEIMINIGISNFTTYINALVEDNNDRPYQITSTKYDLNLAKEGSSAYICFTATDSSGNTVGNLNACNFSTDEAFKAYLIEYLYERDRVTYTSETVIETEEYKTADENRIKLSVGYLNGPYISFVPFDPTNVSFDSTSPEYINNFNITYLQKGIEGVEVPGYSEPGVYFSDYDNVVQVHNTFGVIGDLKFKVGVEIKKYIHIDTGNDKFEDTAEFILTHWKDSSYFETVEYTGGSINLVTPDDDAIYVIRYVDNQHVDDNSTTRNIFRKVVYQSGVPIIDVGTYLPTNTIQVERTSADVIAIGNVVSCYVYNDDGTKNNTGCTLSWNIYDIDYKLIGAMDHEIPRNKIGTYRIIFSAVDSTQIIQAPSVEIVIRIVDITAPTIEFTRPEYKYSTVEYGTTYRDTYTGVLVKDDYDSGNLNYVVAGVVDTSRLGCYTLTYSASDTSGNIGYNKKIVCVIDTKAPTIEMKSGFKNESTMDGEESVDARAYTLERTSTTTFNLNNYIKSLILKVSDNRISMNIENLVISELVAVNPSVCGTYVVKITLNDNAGYTFNFGGDNPPVSIPTSSNNNITTEYIVVRVVDTTAPQVNITNIDGTYVQNNSIVTAVNSNLHVNLFNSEQYEYGDTITVRLNGNEISSNELNTSITSNGYYNFEFIDTSGNLTSISFILMMATYPTIRIGSDSVVFDVNNSYLTDVSSSGSVFVKINQMNSLSNISYEVGDSVVVLGYSTVSSTERYDVLHSFVLTEDLIKLLEIDDYEFEIGNLTCSNVLITKLNAATTQKLGLTEVKDPITQTSSSSGNGAAGIIAIIALVAVAGGAFFLLKKMKRKK